MTETITIETSAATQDSIFSACAQLGVSRDEVVNLAVQLLAQFIAGRRGEVLCVELPNGVAKEVHFH